MSWEAFKPVASASELDDIEIVSELGAEHESEEQVKVAAKVAAALIESGAVGPAEGYHVWLSGHANPGHKELDGAENDRVSVTVGIAAYPGHSDRYPPVKEGA